MGGLGILFVIVFYLAISLLLVIQVKPILAKLAILLIAVLLPTADAVYGRYKLKQMCEAEGGLKIYRVAHDVKGFMGYASEDMIEKYGYEFVEKCSPKLLNCYRYSKKDNDIHREDNVKPKSRYLIRKEFEVKDGKYGYQKYLIEDIKIRNVLATDIQLTFMGGWAEQFLSKFTGAGGGNVARCARPDVLVRIANLITKTLIQ